MKAIVIPSLDWSQVPDPMVGDDEVLVQVKAAGVNRADLLQAKGLYPPPPGATDILGLEVAGIAEGRRVCALIPGGGYAEAVPVHREVLFDIPDHWTFEQGAAVPEVWLTAFVNLFLEGDLKPGESVLIHAGASGVGTAAIQLARSVGAKPFVTVRSPHKAETCRQLGATVLPLQHSERVDVIIDCVGASYLSHNIEALKPFGRLVNIGLLGGTKAELDLGAVMRKRLKIIGSTLRSRSRAEHIDIVRKFKSRFWSHLTGGEFQILIDRTFPITQVAEAHHYMHQNLNIGKIVLCID